MKNKTLDNIIRELIKVNSTIKINVIGINGKKSTIIKQKYLTSTVDWISINFLIDECLICIDAKVGD